MILHLNTKETTLTPRFDAFETASDYVSGSFDWVERNPCNDSLRELRKSLLALRREINETLEELRSGKYNQLGE